MKKTTNLFNNNFFILEALSNKKTIKLRMILFTICSTGFAIENETDTHGNPSIKCATEKGQHKLRNHRTAGKLKVNDNVYRSTK